MAKVGTSNPDRTVSLKRLQCVVEHKNKHMNYNMMHGSMNIKSKDNNAIFQMNAL